MSYNPAYRTQFHSLDDTLYDITLFVNGYEGAPMEISLEGDEPCVIEWKETDVTDVVHSSMCTLRVSNEADRQMAMLMTWRDAALYVARNKVPYWWGYLDDAVYEEPYSYRDGYVTELTFSDFGTLNRHSFLLSGRQSVMDVLLHCLTPIGFGNGTVFHLLTSLLNPKTLQPISLDDIYLDADRLQPDSPDAPTRRQALEDVLRPFGLRIMQTNCQIYIFDIDYLRDHPELHIRIAWKGDDAYLRGSDTHGVFNVEFDTDAQDTLADDGLDYDNENWTDGEQFLAHAYNPDTGNVDQVGFYVESHHSEWLPSWAIKANLGPSAHVFRTRSMFSDASDVGIAWRIECIKQTGWEYNPLLGPDPIPTWGNAILAGNHPAATLAATQEVFAIETGFLPLAPNAGKHLLRIGLDFLISFRGNPFDDDMPDETAQMMDWFDKEKKWKEIGHLPMWMIPARLELIDEQGNAIHHYTNAKIEDLAWHDLAHNPTQIAKANPYIQGGGRWETGPANGFADMVLSFYKDYDPDDKDPDPLVNHEWTHNRISLQGEPCINGSFYGRIADGEYISLPPAAGRLRLTVGSGLFPVLSQIGVYGAYYCSYNLPLYAHLRWQLYRNPTIAIVQAGRRDNAVNADPATEADDVLNLWPNPLDESVSFGCWQRGVPPSARGLLTLADGTTLEKLTRGYYTRTLLSLRLIQLEDQTIQVQPSIEGTAELVPQFAAFNDAFTPGAFLATAIRQDLHDDTQHVTLHRIAPIVSLTYDFSWSTPVCATEFVDNTHYTFLWSEALCVLHANYTFLWSQPVCAQQYIYHMDWTEI